MTNILAMVIGRSHLLIFILQGDGMHVLQEFIFPSTLIPSNLTFLDISTFYKPYSDFY